MKLNVLVGDEGDVGVEVVGIVAAAAGLMMMFLHGVSVFLLLCFFLFAKDKCHDGVFLGVAIGILLLFLVPRLALLLTLPFDGLLVEQDLVKVHALGEAAAAPTVTLLGLLNLEILHETFFS